MNTARSRGANSGYSHFEAAAKAHALTACEIFWVRKREQLSGEGFVPRPGSARTKVLASLVCALSLTLLTACAARAGKSGVNVAAAPTERVIAADRDGMIRLGKAAFLADRTLRRARYEFRYRLDGPEYLLRIVEVRPEYPLAKTPWQWKTQLGDVPCRVEPLAERAEQTRVLLVREGEAHRIAWVELAGHAERCHPQGSLR